MTQSSLTIINNKNLRGVLAPTKTLSKELLEDIVDLIEWSTPEAFKETEKRVREADKNNSWISAKDIEKQIRKRAKLSK